MFEIGEEKLYSDTDQWKFKTNGEHLGHDISLLYFILFYFFLQQARLFKGRYPPDKSLSSE